MHVMGAAPPNRVRALRELRGLSQIALAAAAGLTRQSVGAIEAGRAMPGVDVALRLSRALDCKVEDLFGGASATSHVVAEPAARGDGRVLVAQIAGRWVSYPLSGLAMGGSADGLAPRTRRGRTEVELLRPLADATQNLVLMGCAPALGLLADRLNARSGPGRFLWVAASSTKALDALSKGRTHVAGVHLVDARTGEANVPDVRRHGGADPMVLVTLARWEAGLVTAKGNPKQVTRAADLGRPGLRLVSREPGSGARRLLDQSLDSAGLSHDLAKAAPVVATGHLEVAHAVSIGAGDVGIATRDAAIAFGLGFVPIAEERFDLAIHAAHLPDPRVQRLLDAMTTAAFRRELASLGYDASSSGDRVAEIAAA